MNSKIKWECKLIYGQYIRSMDGQLINEEDTFLWAQWGDLKGETETEITAAHDQALQTKQHTTKYYKHKRDNKCRSCQ